MTLPSDTVPAWLPTGELVLNQQQQRSISNRVVTMLDVCRDYLASGNNSVLYHRVPFNKSLTRRQRLKYHGTHLDLPRKQKKAARKRLAKAIASAARSALLKAYSQDVVLTEWLKGSM